MIVSVRNTPMLIPSTVRRVIWKKIVCLFVCNGVKRTSYWYMTVISHERLKLCWTLGNRVWGIRIWCWILKILIRFFSSMVVPTDEIPIFHKVWPKVIGYGESESGVGFWKFLTVFSNHIPSTVRRVIWKKFVCPSVCTWGQKNISHENTKISISTQF